MEHTIDRRQGGIRRDFNNLVRDESGALSPTKIGTLVGQWLSVKLILENGEKIIANWDSLTVLFAVLIAPELFKKFFNMKYGDGKDLPKKDETVVLQSITTSSTPTAPVVSEQTKVVRKKVR